MREHAPSPKSSMSGPAPIASHRRWSLPFAPPIAPRELMALSSRALSEGGLAEAIAAHAFFAFDGPRAIGDARVPADGPHPCPIRCAVLWAWNAALS